MVERRESYREKQGTEAIRVSMSWRGSEAVDGVLIDASAKGVAVSVSVPVAGSPALPIGTSVFLTIAPPGMDPIEDVVAVVRNERERDERRIFGLEIIDWRRLHDTLPPRLFATFNRRRHYRVSPPSETEVAVSMRQGDRSTKALLSNISMSGCLLLFEPENAPEPDEALAMEFRLPDVDFHFRLSGTVKSVSEYRKAACCGIAFDETGSHDFQRQQTRLSRYVMQRQREQKAVK